MFHKLFIKIPRFYVLQKLNQSPDLLNNIKLDMI